jgi:hypothetical protein
MRHVLTVTLFITAVLSITSRSSQAWITNDDVANASAGADTAQGKANAAQSRLDVIVKSIRARFESSPEYTAAKDELDSSSTAYDADRATVINTLHGTQEYQDACTARDQAVATIAQARKDGDTPEDIISAAQDAMKARHAVTELETKALADDPTYQTSKKRFQTATTVMRKLEEKYKLILATSTDYQQAKADLDNAQGNLTSALAAASDIQSQKNRQDIDAEARAAANAARNRQR